MQNPGSCWLMQNPGFLLADAEFWIPVGWSIILDFRWMMHYAGFLWLMQNPGFLLADALSWIPVGWCRILDPVGWCKILDFCWQMQNPGFPLADPLSWISVGWWRIAVNRKQKSYWQFNSTMRLWMWISKKLIWSWFNSTSTYRKWWAGSITQIPCRGFTWYSTNRDSKPCNPTLRNSIFVYT